MIMLNDTFFNSILRGSNSVQFYQTDFLFIEIVITENILFLPYSLRVLGCGSEDGCSNTLWTAGVLPAAGGTRSTAAERNTEEEHCYRMAI